ncbi:MAG: 30S ribosomal protein S17 [Thermoanaerobaculia bacterium]
MSEQINQQRGRRQSMVGRVVSSKMNRTVVVAVENTVMHDLYRRQMKKTTKFYAHDEENECRAGDRVRLVSTRPLSRLKRWRVAEILERSEE